MTYRFHRYLFLIAAASLLAVAGCEREALTPEQPDTIPPLAPGGLYVEAAHDGYAVLRWSRNSEKDFRAYVIHRADGTSIPFRAVDSTGNNYYVDEPLAYDTLYSYYLTAIDESGNESKPSPAVSTNSPNSTAPDPPSDFIVNGRNLDGTPVIQLEWRPNGEADLAEYLIYRSTTPDVRADQAQFLARTANSFYVDTSITGTNRTYYYAILAVDAGGKQSPLSGTDADQVLDRALQIAPADNQQTGSIPAFSWNTVQGAVLYKIIVSSTPLGDEISSWLVGPGSGSTLSSGYTGVPLDIGRLYYWRVGALSKQQTSPNSLSLSSAFHVVSRIAP